MSRPVLYVPPGTRKRLGPGNLDGGARRLTPDGPSMEDEMVDVDGTKLWIPGIADQSPTRREEIAHWQQEQMQQADKDALDEDGTAETDPDKIADGIAGLRERAEWEEERSRRVADGLSATKYF